MSGVQKNQLAGVVVSKVLALGSIRAASGFGNTSSPIPGDSVERVLIPSFTVTMGTAAPDLTITDVTAGTGGVIQITTSTPLTGYSDGTTVVVSGVTGTTEANNAWVITITGTNTFTLDDSIFVNAYTGGGTAAKFAVFLMDFNGQFVCDVLSTGAPQVAVQIYIDGAPLDAFGTHIPPGLLGENRGVLVTYMSRFGIPAGVPTTFEVRIRNQVALSTGGYGPFSVFPNQSLRLAW